MKNWRSFFQCLTSFHPSKPLQSAKRHRARTMPKSTIVLRTLTLNSFSRVELHVSLLINILSNNISLIGDNNLGWSQLSGMVSVHLSIRNVLKFPLGNTERIWNIFQKAYLEYLCIKCLVSPTQHMPDGKGKAFGGHSMLGEKKNYVWDETWGRTWYPLSWAKAFVTLKETLAFPLSHACPLHISIALPPYLCCWENVFANSWQGSLSVELLLLPAASPVEGTLKESFDTETIAKTMYLVII